MFLSCFLLVVGEIFVGYYVFDSNTKLVILYSCYVHVCCEEKRNYNMITKVPNIE